MKMKRVLTVPRFAVSFVCVVAFIAVVVAAQSESEKTWDDAVALFNAAFVVHEQARVWDAIDLYEEALVIFVEIVNSISEARSLMRANCYCSDLSGCEVLIGTSTCEMGSVLFFGSEAR
jgi:hypothetical protein